MQTRLPKFALLRLLDRFHVRWRKKDAKVGRVYLNRAVWRGLKDPVISPKMSLCLIMLQYDEVQYGRGVVNYRGSGTTTVYSLLGHNAYNLVIFSYY